MGNAFSAFYKVLDSLLVFLIPFILLSSAPFFSGSGYTPVFFFRATTFIAFIVYIAKIIFFKASNKDEDQKIVRISALLFSIFILFALIQWAGGFQVFTKYLPGTLVRYKTLDYTIQLFAYLAFFLMCFDFLQSAKRLRIIVNLIIFEATCLVAFGFYQRLSWMGHTNKMFGIIQMPEGLQSFFSTFINPNHYGGYLVLLTLLCAPSILLFTENYKESSRSSSLALQCVSYVVFVLLATLSIFYASARASFIAQIFALALFLGIASSHRHRMRIFSLFVLLGVAYIGLMKIVRFNLPFEDYLKNYLQAVHGRLMISQDMLRAFLDYPFFGTGLGTSKYITDSYSIFYAHYFELMHVLNHHIELLFTAGMIGYTLVFAAFGYYILRSYIRFHKSTRTDAHIYGFASLVAILVFLFPMSFFDDYLRTPTVALFFIFHLCIVGRSASMHPEASPDRPLVIGRIPNIKIHTIVFFILMASAMAGMLIYIYKDWKVSRSMIFESKNYESLQKSTKIIKNNPELWLTLGNAYSREALRLNNGDRRNQLSLKAIQSFQKATKYAPTWAKAWAKLGMANMLLGDESEGLPQLIKAVGLAPHNRNYYLYLVVSLLRASERTHDVYLKQFYMHEAVAWLEKGSHIAVPITSDTLDYLLTINKGDPFIRLTEWDKKRLERMLSRQTLAF